MNRVLAIASPNLRYEHYRNYKGVLIQAVLRENRVLFYEIHTNNKEWIVRLSEERVKSLFEASTIIRDQPFLKKENQKFITVLYRHRKKYREAFEKLKNPSKMKRGNKPKMKRNAPNL